MTSTNPNQFDNTTGQTQPTLYENVTNTVSNAAQSAYNSIPSVKPDASTQTPDTSFPSREHEGAQPFERTGGVGALPGSLGETSVAKLPEQRAAEIPHHPPTDQHPVATTTNSIPHPSNPAAGGHGFSPAPATGEHGSSITSGQHGSTLTSTGVNVNPSGTTDLPPYPPRGAPSQTPAQPGTFGSTTQTAYNALPQPVKNTAERANDPAQPGLVQKAKDVFLGATGLGAAQVHHSLPSQETEGVKPGEHHDGVGPLPGRLDDTSVAKLPAEREDPNPLSRPHHATQPPLSAERSEHGTNPLSADARFDATHGSHPSADRTRGTDPLHAAAHPIATAEKHTTDRPTDRVEDRGEHRTNPLHAAAHPIATAEKHTTDRPRERTEGTGEHRPLHAAAHPIDTDERHTTDRPREHTEGTGEHRPLHAAAHPVDTAERHTTDRPREHTEGTGEHRPLHAAAHPVDTSERHTGTHPTDRPTDHTEHRDEHRTDHPMEGVEGTTKVPLKDKIKGEMKILSGHLTSHAAKVDEGRAIKKGTASTAH